MLFIYFKAPFGAFRAFHSVELSATAEFVTYSAAYGLMLGMAGVDRNRKKEFEGAQIALGTWDEKFPLRGRVFQQFHWVKEEGRGSHKKGKETLKEAFERSKGTKPDIRTIWKEYLHKIEGYIGLDNPELEKLVRQGINEPETLNYWGLPFMGDNNFFIERFEEIEHPKPCQWFYPVGNETVYQGQKLFYLPVWTDYVSNNSASQLFNLGPLEGRASEGIQCMGCYPGRSKNCGEKGYENISESESLSPLQGSIVFIAVPGVAYFVSLVLTPGYFLATLQVALLHGTNRSIH